MKVDAVVQGAIVRSGYHVRISARLVEAASDRHVWAHNYDGELGDILTLQQRIAGDIAAAATGRRVPASARTRRHQTVDPVAADAYLKGMFAFGQGTYEGFRTAVEYLEQAISRQNDYVDAYAALGQVQLQLLFVGPLSPRQVVPTAEAAVRKAIELDETLPQPHQTLGTILTHFHWKWDEGDKEFRRAKELSGAGPTAGTSGMVLGLVRTGQIDEAIAEATGERDRDPRSIGAQLNLAIAHRTAANYDRSIAEFLRALEMMPRNPRAHFQLGVTYALMGRYDAAIRELEAWESKNPRFMAYLGYTYAAAGRSQDARKVLDDLKSRALEQYMSSFGIALIHDALGEKELALAALERACDDRAVECAQMTQYPRFKTIASEERYEAVMRRVGLPR